jgi:hypothetical protein
MWKGIFVCRKWLSKNENVVCFSFNLQKRNGDKHVGKSITLTIIMHGENLKLMLVSVYSKLRCKRKSKVNKEIPPCEAIEE